MNIPEDVQLIQRLQRRSRYDAIQREGEVSRREEVEETSQTEEYEAPSKFITFFRLLSLSSCCDILCITLGLLCSFIQGGSTPFLGLLFGKMTDAFLQTSLLDEATNDTQLTLREVPRCNASNSSDEVCVTPEQWITQMRNYSLYYLIICCAIYVSAFLQTICWESSCEKQIFKLRKIFFSKILRQEISWYELKQEGDLSNKLWDDMEKIREGIGYKCSKVTQHFSTFVIGLTIGFWSNYKLTSSLLGFLPFLIWLSCLFTKFSSQSAKREQEKYSVASSIADQVLHSLRTVTAFGGERKEGERYKLAIEEGSKLVMKKYCYSAILIFTLTALKFLANSAAFVYGAHLIEKEDFKPGTVFVVIYSVLNSAFEVANLLPFWDNLILAINSAENIFRIIDRRPKIDSCSESGLRPELSNAYIEFKDVCFSYPCRENVQVLKNLSFTIESGETVAIIGPSGSGKSSIIKLLLRFYDPSNGEVWIDGHDIKKLNLKCLRNQIGVVSQEPVLFRGTIAENVRYGREDATMNDIEEACRLANAHTFISNLPNKYMTEVGPRGVQLSGGEKQRIAIARALIRNPRILLLDEATSALDSQNEACVQQALDQAMVGRTTIIVAHRLSTIRDVNRIFALKDGEIVESGNHEELMTNAGLYYDLVKAQERRIREKPISPDKYKTKEDDRIAAGPSTSKLQIQSPCVPPVNLQQQKSNHLFRLLKLNSSEWHYLMIGIFCAAIGGTTVPVKSFFYGQFYADFQMSVDKFNSAFFLSTILAVFGIISGIAYSLQTLAMSYSTEKLTTRLRSKSFMNILRQPASWFDEENYSIGKLLTRLSRDGAAVKSAGGMRISMSVQCAVSFIAGYIIALIYGWQLALILLIVVPFVMIASYYNLKQMRYSQVRDNQSKDNAGQVVSECLQNITTVQSLAKEHVFVNKYNHLLQMSYREIGSDVLRFACVQGLSETMICVMFTISFYIGSFLIASEFMGPSDVYRVLFAISLCAQNVGQTIGYLKDWKTARASAQNLLDLLDKKSELDPTSDEGLKPEIHGKITFNNVVFSYPSRPHVTVLDGLNFTVDAGETLALVGVSGSGKSTIISLLERFYLPNSGEILIDEYNISEINIGHLRGGLGLVTQEPDLFNCSVRENIAYGALHDSISDQDIIAAAKTANIHDFIMTLPQGYETVCGDHGAQVSGGEKQRIAIARAIVRQPKILLLDEATSALDTASEKVVQEALDRARTGRTSIIIAHRLSTVQNADKIAVINNGRIAEIGTHEQLISIEGGYYFKLTKRQQI